MSGSVPKKSSAIVVVETARDYVKIVQANRSGKGRQVVKLHLHKIDRSREDVASDVMGALRKLKMGFVPVIACLPRQSVNVRFLEIPSTNPSEIDDMVELQIDRQTPYSRDEIVADYRIVGPGSKGYTKVMLIIIQRSQMRHRFVLLEKAGANVNSMCVSSEGILSWFHAAMGGAGARGTHILLDVDKAYTDLTIVSRGQLVFTKSIRIGAEQLKKDFDGWKNRFLQDVRHSVEIYRAESHDDSVVQQLVLTGVGPGIEGLEKMLSEELSLAVQSIDALHRIQHGSGLPDLTGEDYADVSFTALIGMAISPETLEFSLVPDTVRRRRSLAVKARVLTAMGVWLIVVMGMSSLWTATAMQKKVINLLGLDQMIKDIAEEVEDVRKKRETTLMIMDRLDSSHAPVSLLRELHRVTPVTIGYDSISIEEGRRMILRGRATGYQDVNTLRSNLDDSEVIPPDVKPGPARKQDDLVQFEVVCSSSSEGGTP
jgi:Tfp pilus assembly PilM family ATPase